MHLHDVWEGVVKSLAFGVAVSLVAVYEGYHSSHPRGCGPRDHAHRGDFIGARAGVELSADGRVPNNEVIGNV